MGLWDEIQSELRENIAVQLIKSGRETLENIAKYCDLPIQRVQELASTIS